MKSPAKYNQVIKIRTNFIFFFLFTLFYIIYPVWYLSQLTKTGIFVILNVYLLISALLLNYSLLVRSELVVNFTFKSKKVFYTIIVAGLIDLAHLPFWTLPVKVGGDMQSHVSPAASSISLLYSYLPLIERQIRL